MSHELSAIHQYPVPLFSLFSIVNRQWSIRRCTFSL
jgi:hypothetical protein